MESEYLLMKNIVLYMTLITIGFVNILQGQIVIQQKIVLEEKAAGIGNWSDLNSKSWTESNVTPLNRGDKLHKSTLEREYGYFGILFDSYLYFSAAPYIKLRDSEAASVTVNVVSCTNPGIRWAVMLINRSIEFDYYHAVGNIPDDGFNRIEWTSNLFPKGSSLGFLAVYDDEDSVAFPSNEPTITIIDANTYRITCPWLVYDIIFIPAKILVSTTPDSMEHNQTSVITAEGYDDNGVELPDNTLFKITMDETAGKLGSLYSSGSAGVEVLPIVTYAALKDSTISYKADGAKNFGTVTGIINATLISDPEETGSSYISVNGISDYHYETIVYPKQLMKTDTAVVQIVARDATGEEVILPPDTPIQVTFDGSDSNGRVTGSLLGRLELAYGTEITSSSNITYRDARAGNLTYISTSDGFQDIIEIFISFDDSRESSYGELFVTGAIPYFEIISDPISINYSDTSVIHITLKNANGEVVNSIDDITLPPGLPLPPGFNIPFDLPLDVRILKDDGATNANGTFLLENGDMIQRLVDIPYGQVYNGQIKYIAAFPKSDEKTVVHIETQFTMDPQLMGIGEIEVEPKYTLDIMIPEPAQIWPTQTGDEGQNVQENIEVKMEKDGEPVANQKIIINLQMILPSGGHDHVNQPPANLMGQLVGDRPGGIQVTVTTNDLGIGYINYTAPEFGGIFKFAAITNIGGNTLQKADTLTVRVPDLILLPESEHYTKVGGTAIHHGPPIYLEEDNNHFGNQTTIQTLENIAKSWHTQFPNEHTLYINDISLPFGGLFDVNGNWLPEHSSHRTGMDVDIKTELPSFRPGIPVRIPRDATNWQNTQLIKNAIFEEICERFGVDADIHADSTIYEHYHLDF